jgi:hemerythrin-like metal-binding protein
MKFHLAVEEAMLEIVRYPQHADHCQAHAKIMDQIAELEKQLQRTGSETTLVTFFEDWFIRHVLGEDRQYAAYVKEEFPGLCGQAKR